MKAARVARSRWGTLALAVLALGCGGAGASDELSPDAGLDAAPPDAAPAPGLMPQVSRSRGHVDAPFALTITAADGAELYVTTDGSAAHVDPDLRYGGPIDIATSTTVRAMARYPDRGLSTPEIVHTYLFLDEVIAAPTMQARITSDPVYGPMVRPALQALPSIFLSTAGPLTADEKVAVAVELFDPAGAEPGFSITAGAKLVGAHSLGAYPKNNIRLYFEDGFGPTKLRYPLYAACCAAGDAAPVATFDQLTLRSGAHDSAFYLGADQQPWGNGQYARNRFFQEAQRRMGQASTNGRYVQVFIDRAYAGQFDLQEQPDASFLAERFGGDKADYADVNGAVLGDVDVWASVKAATTTWATAEAWIDIDSLIDYQLLMYVAGNDWDWLTRQNWLAAGPRTVPAPSGERWRFFAWDCDVALLNPLADVTDPDAISRTGWPMDPPDGVFTALRAFPEFRDRVAERAALHFAPGGALSDEAMRDAYDEVAGRIELAVIAESARWGDWAGVDWTRDGDWAPERARITSEFFDGRADLVVAQLRAQGILPP